VDSPIASYFRLPVVPTVMGFDPRLQFLHDSDLMAVLQHAVKNDVPGTFNIAGDGIITLSQAARRLGRPMLPLPSFAVSRVGSLLHQAGVADFSREQLAFLTYGRGVDTSRMRDVLGFHPAHSTATAFADFAASQKPGLNVTDRALAGLSRTLVGAQQVGANHG